MDEPTSNVFLYKNETVEKCRNKSCQQSFEMKAETFQCKRQPTMAV